MTKKSWERTKKSWELTNKSWETLYWPTIGYGSGGGAIVVKQTRVEIKLSYEKCCDANVVVEVKRVTRRRRRHRIVFLRVCSTITFWVPKLDLLRWRRGKIVLFITIDMLMFYVLFLFCFFYLPVSRTANVWFVVLPLTAKSHWYINPYARIGKKIKSYLKLSLVRIPLLGLGKRFSNGIKSCDSAPRGKKTIRHSNKDNRTTCTSS